MRNKLILSIALFLCTLGLFAQDFEIVSVESLPADMSAREEMKTDHNDRQCALLRVATQNIEPEQREGFSFVPDLGSEVVERATRDGEIWLWVSPGIKYLRIKHRDWGQYELRLQDYVTRVEALHTYKVAIKGILSMTVQEPENNSTTQQLISLETHQLIEKGDECYDKKDYVEAVNYLREAANRGDAEGQVKLGYMYDYGYGVKKNYAEALRLYQLAANQGNARAQNNIGTLYQYGEGVSVDYDEALKWYRLSANQGYSVAQSNLGYMYYRGYGVTQNYEEASQWFLKAANQGYDYAQYILGFMYLNGYGVDKDLSEAYKWTKLAAEQGYPTAQYILGIMYERGDGVMQSRDTAIHWYRMAAEQGDENAKTRLQQLSR